MRKRRRRTPARPVCARAGRNSQREDHHEEDDCFSRHGSLGALRGASLGAEKKKLAFIVNAASDFWKLAEAGVKKAQGELPNYELQFKYPAQGTAALQNALMDDLVAAGTNAIMISSVDPKTSIDAFNRIAAQVPLFTTDSDAPASNRIAYLGSSNTLAGVQAGEIAVKALPKGGKCMGFVGFLGADNAKERIAGFKQGHRGQGHRACRRARRRRRFRQGAQQCRRRAGGQARTSIAWSASIPTTRRRSTRRSRRPASSGKITVIAFDEDPITLGAVKDGSFAGTVVQQPFEWGYQGMKLMAAYLEGDKSKIPADKLIIVPTKLIDKANVDAFEANLKATLGK